MGSNRVIDDDDDDAPPPPLKYVARRVGERKRGLRITETNCSFDNEDACIKYFEQLLREKENRAKRSRFAPEPESPPAQYSHSITVCSLSNDGSISDEEKLPAVLEKKVELTSSQKKAALKRKFNAGLGYRSTIAYQKNSSWAYSAEVTADVLRDVVEEVALKIEGPRKPGEPIPAWMAKF